MLGKKGIGRWGGGEGFESCRMWKRKETWRKERGRRERDRERIRDGRKYRRVDGDRRKKTIQKGDEKDVKRTRKKFKSKKRKGCEVQTHGV